MAQLKDLRVAILVEEGFEQIELTNPREALQQAGVQAEVVSPQEGEVKAWDKDNWGTRVKVDKPLDEAKADDYDALLLPGGVMNPDDLRQNEKAVAFIRHFLENGKPVAAICHAPWSLIETGLLKGRTVTSYPSLKSDLMNAGALWVDREVVVDKGLVTSRSPKDLPAFNKKMLEEFAEGVHARAV